LAASYYSPSCGLSFYANMKIDIDIVNKCCGDGYHEAILIKKQLEQVYPNTNVCIHIINWSPIIERKTGITKENIELIPKVIIKIDDNILLVYSLGENKIDVVQGLIQHM